MKKVLLAMTLAFFSAASIADCLSNERQVISASKLLSVKHMHNGVALFNNQNKDIFLDSFFAGGIRAGALDVIFLKNSEISRGYLYLSEIDKIISNDDVSTATIMSFTSERYDYEGSLMATIRWDKNNSTQYQANRFMIKKNQGVVFANVRKKSPLDITLVWCERK